MTATYRLHLYGRRGEPGGRAAGTVPGWALIWGAMAEAREQLRQHDGYTHCAIYRDESQTAHIHVWREE